MRKIASSLFKNTIHFRQLDNFADVFKMPKLIFN